MILAILLSMLLLLAFIMNLGTLATWFLSDFED